MLLVVFIIRLIFPIVSLFPREKKNVIRKHFNKITPSCKCPTVGHTITVQIKNWLGLASTYRKIKPANWIKHKIVSPTSGIFEGAAFHEQSFAQLAEQKSQKGVKKVQKSQTPGISGSLYLQLGQRRYVLRQKTRNVEGRRADGVEQAARVVFEIPIK